MKTREDLIKYIEETKEYALGLFDEDPADCQDFKDLLKNSQPVIPYETKKDYKRGTLDNYIETLREVSLDLFEADDSERYLGPKQVVLEALESSKF